MAKLSSIEKNNRRKILAKTDFNRRKRLKEKIYDKNISSEERFNLVLKMASLRRNGAQTRVRRRCEVTGRSRAVLRKFKVSRIVFRSLASEGLIPGVTKASW